MSFARRIPPTDGRYVAARALDFGDWKVAEGEEFPWRERGMDERNVQRRWWRGELEAAPPIINTPAPAEAVVTFNPPVPAQAPKQPNRKRAR